MWQSRNSWFQQRQLFTVPIVMHSFEDSVQNAGNIYGKGGLVLNMLRRHLGPADFFKALKHYLETNRHKNVVTADLTKAIEEATGKNVDLFFDQWVYGAGAPRFEVSYSFDAAAKQVNLDVKQTQKVEGRVGLFRVPIEVEITSAAGKASHNISVSKASESFSLPADSAPLLVLFDKGNQVLKSVEFKKDPKEWIYQLKNAEAVADRADAAVELGKLKGNADAAAALGEAALNDKFWGIRAQALRALGSIGGPEAQKQIKAALANEQPWVRSVAVQLMGNFKDDATAAETLEKIFREDRALRVRTTALSSLAQQKPKNAFDVLKEATAMDSIDDAIRAAALRSLGSLGDDRAVPIALEAAAAGHPFPVRSAAISSLGRLDKKNKDLTKKIVAYFDEPNRSIQFQFGVLSALIERGDTDALPAVDAWLKRTELPIGASFIQQMIARLRGPAAGAQPAAAAGQPGAGAGTPQAGPADASQMMQMGMQIMQQLEALRKENAEIRDRLKKIEEKVGEKKP
jgi:aminopeptidase N